MHYSPSMSSVDALGILQDLCPDAATDTITQALSASNGNIEEAAQQLLSGKTVCLASLLTTKLSGISLYKMHMY